MLAALVEQRAGGQRTLPVGRPLGRDPVSDATLALAVGAAITGGGRPSGPNGSSAPEGAAPSGEPRVDNEPVVSGVEATAAAASAGREGTPAPAGTTSVAIGETSAARRERRPARYGLSIQFEPRPDDPELARLIESTVWVNESHPAYRRAVASRSEGYHVAVASAMALASVAVEPAKEHAFVTAFLESWGAAIERRKRGRRR